MCYIYRTGRLRNFKTGTPIEHALSTVTASYKGLWSWVLARGRRNTVSAALSGHAACLIFTSIFVCVFISALLPRQILQSFKWETAVIVIIVFNISYRNYDLLIFSTSTVSCILTLQLCMTNIQPIYFLLTCQKRMGAKVAMLVFSFIELQCNLLSQRNTGDIVSSHTSQHWQRSSWWRTKWLTAFRQNRQLYIGPVLQPRLPPAWPSSRTARRSTGIADLPLPGWSETTT